MKPLAPLLGFLLAPVLAMYPVATNAQQETGNATPVAVQSHPPQEPIKQEAERLTVGSWGGAYSKSQEIAFTKPFSDKTGIEVNLVRYEDILRKLKRSNVSSPPAWDVLDLDARTAEQACSEGLLEKINLEDISAAGGDTASPDDFLDGALQECGIAAVAWSSIIVFDKRVFKKAQPSSPKDFFDVKKFPGKRAIPRDPEYILGLALMADGIAPQDVYAHLESPTGIDHALAMLDRIGDEIIWWKRGREPAKLLAEGTAALAIAFNGRIFHSIVRENRPFGIVWKGQIYNLDMWTMPKGSPNRDAALKFIAFSTRPDRLAEQTRWLPYGPMRKSAIASIGRHAETKIDMAPFIPTTKMNFTDALLNDASWWVKNESRVKSRMDIWLQDHAARQIAKRERMSKNDKADKKTSHRKHRKHRKK